MLAISRVHESVVSAAPNMAESEDERRTGHIRDPGGAATVQCVSSTIG